MIIFFPSIGYICLAIAIILSIFIKRKAEALQDKTDELKQQIVELKMAQVDLNNAQNEFIKLSEQLNEKMQEKTGIYRRIS
ncbi:hypothetical protein GZH47_33240 (plasmid) [Paenibacillus rhizovicinus]|uniref:Uncharacterized protein n=1 Tax=Paenibacillus rhizovicinus TaxID=2704463 RepID=A0A6C0PB05_9BACL|nr:hypothetical protein [Paenibacillus rhizovicinus]QHW35760.1 hypothetical protein GZH47_33240 [Paenibacillus rhizovicinus]